MSDDLKASFEALKTAYEHVLLSNDQLRAALEALTEKQDQETALLKASAEKQEQETALLKASTLKQNQEQSQETAQLRADFAQLRADNAILTTRTTTMERDASHSINLADLRVCATFTARWIFELVVFAVYWAKNQKTLSNDLTFLMAAAGLVATHLDPNCVKSVSIYLGACSKSESVVYCLAPIISVVAGPLSYWIYTYSAICCYRRLHGDATVTNDHQISHPEIRDGSSLGDGGASSNHPLDDPRHTDGNAPSNSDIFEQGTREENKGESGAAETKGRLVGIEPIQIDENLKKERNTGIVEPLLHGYCGKMSSPVSGCGLIDNDV